MADDSDPQPDATSDDEGGSLVGLLVSLGILVTFVAFWWLHKQSPGGPWAMLYLVAQVALISVVIWQVCDPFADAAQWVGQKFQLPGSVRGATLDAVASSMPELFSGIFFVWLAVSAAGANGDAEALAAAGAEGFGSTLATCAGSAVYNMILIPAFCALVISYTRPARPTIDVEDEVIARDGVWFLACEILLIMFLFEETMYWWMGVTFLLLYGIYVCQLILDARQHKRRRKLLEAWFAENGPSENIMEVANAIRAQGTRISVNHIESYLQDQDEADEDEVQTAGVFFGYFDVPLNGLTTMLVLLTSTLLAAGACYFLVEATIETADILQVPAFFVAVIVAAAASSVPDTFLAIAAARRGDDSGAVSNAFGSNIFDICICLSIPLLINSWLTGWSPVSLLQDGKPINGLVGLRILLVVLTVTNLAIMWHNRQITRNKAWIMCGLYLVFVGYAVLGSLGILDA